MIVPDSAMIAEIILFGEGFSHTKVRGLAVSGVDLIHSFLHLSLSLLSLFSLSLFVAVGS